MQNTGCLGLVHWDDPERWYGDGGGRGVQDWELMYTRGGFMLMYGKTNTVLQNKVKLKKRKEKKSRLIWTLVYQLFLISLLRFPYLNKFE